MCATVSSVFGPQHAKMYVMVLWSQLNKMHLEIFELQCANMFLMIFGVAT